jgi:2-iminobutanoate/2-iminopropanoate deaminase
MSNGTGAEAVYLSSASTADLPFCDAVRVGNLLYLSGQIGVDENVRVVPGGIVEETKRAMENIRGTLERYGSSLDRVVKVTVMLADMAEWAEMNKVYVTYFPQHLPARSAFGTTGLALGARVEIECFATVG